MNKEKTTYESYGLESSSVSNNSGCKILMMVWNNTYAKYDKEQTIYEMFEEQAKLNPHGVAVVYKDRHITYQELNQYSNQLANRLRKEGVKPDVLVAICAERSLEVMIGILAILKAGGAYVPLDPEHPSERLRFILGDICAPVLLTQQHLVDKCINYSGNIILLDNLLNEKISFAVNLNKTVTAKNLAYTIYTSGTTGRPKGVTITHGAITNHMVWMKKCFSFDPSDVTLQKTVLSFDASVWELFIPIITGGKLVFADPGAHRDPRALIKLIREYKVTTLQLVPTMLKEFLKQEDVVQCVTLRHVFAGGEMLSEDIRRLFFQKLPVRLYNLYGPTETTIESTFHPCENSEEDFALNCIGKPINNTQVYVLDSQMQLTPIGIPGQLYIGGDGLARGYLNNSALTTSNFIVNPFSLRKEDRLYKTGDLVRWLSNGSLEYLGRLDDQVKIRGFRVEINEIENCLSKAPMINQCAVVVENVENSMEQPHLTAYLVLANKKDIAVTKLLNFLKHSLPEYMVPSVFKVVEKLPISVNGKVDKKSLITMEATVLSLENNYVAPANHEEKTLTDIWVRVLKAKQQIGVHDNFFDLGGNSLLALEVLTQVNKYYSVDMGMQSFFEVPTIFGFSSIIRNTKKKADKIKSRVNHNVQFKSEIDSPVIALRSGGDKTPLFLIHPVGGTVFWYMKLVKHLKTNRPVYGIQDPGIVHKNLIFSSIEELAEFYLQWIRKVQPHGPYMIGGASFGATVSVEVARKIQELGEKVCFIPILDGWAIYPNKLLNDSYFKDTMNRQHEQLRAQFAAKNIENMESIFDLQWQRLTLLWKYKMLPVEHKIILFKSEELLPAFRTIESPLNYWDDYAMCPIDVHAIPGDHETMFQEPYVAVLAQKLNSCLL
jgi:amino acid adenylation domain-containing protein